VGVVLELQVGLAAALLAQQFMQAQLVKDLLEEPQQVIQTLLQVVVELQVLVAMQPV
jgi:hypothetical protein